MVIGSPIVHFAQIICLLIFALSYATAEEPPSSHSVPDNVNKKAIFVLLLITHIITFFVGGQE